MCFYDQTFMQIISHSLMKKLSKCHLNLNRWQEKTCWDMSVEVANYQEVIDSLHDPEILLIDVRDPSEIDDSGSIPTSLNIPCKIKISFIFLIIFSHFNWQWSRSNQNFVSHVWLLLPSTSVTNLVFFKNLSFIASLVTWVNWQQKQLLKLDIESSELFL